MNESFKENLISEEIGYIKRLLKKEKGYYDGIPVIPPEIERMSMEELDEKIKEYERYIKK